MQYVDLLVHQVVELKILEAVAKLVSRRAELLCPKRRAVEVRVQVRRRANLLEVTGFPSRVA